MASVKDPHVNGGEFPQPAPKQHKDSPFVDFKRLIGHPSSGTEMKSSSSIEDVRSEIPISSSGRSSNV